MEYDEKIEDIEIIVADGSALPTITTLLAENGLLTEDNPGKLGELYLGYAGGNLLGIGGVENFDKCGLPRSLILRSSVYESLS